MTKDHYVGETGYVFGEAHTPRITIFLTLLQSVVDRRAPGSVAVGFTPIFATYEEAKLWDVGVSAAATLGDGKDAE